jgi:predicted PurR-regulated permease PerM
MNDQRGPFLSGPKMRSRSWLQQLALTVVGVAVIVVAFFFVTVALIVGVLLAIGIALRWWWVVRRLRKASANSESLEGEYVVIERADSDSQRR